MIGILGDPLEEIKSNDLNFNLFSNDSSLLDLKSIELIESLTQDQVLLNVFRSDDKFYWTNTGSQTKKARELNVVHFGGNIIDEIASLFQVFVIRHQISQVCLVIEDPVTYQGISLSSTVEQQVGFHLSHYQQSLRSKMTINVNTTSSQMTDFVKNTLGVTNNQCEVVFVGIDNDIVLSSFLSSLSTTMFSGSILVPSKTMYLIQRENLPVPVSLYFPSVTPPLTSQLQGNVTGGAFLSNFWSDTPNYINTLTTPPSMNNSKSLNGLPVFLFFFFFEIS